MKLVLLYETKSYSYYLLSTDPKASHPTTPRDIDDNTDPDVDEKPSNHGSDVEPANCSNVYKQLSTQKNDVIANVHETSAYTNKDYNSVLCEGTISHSPATDVS